MLVMLAALAAGFAVAPGSGAAIEKIVVDDLRDNCPGADYTSIQAGVDAAIAAGVSTVAVCKGLYVESVRIPAAGAGLKIDGPARRWGETSCTADRLPSPATDAVVTGTAGYGVVVEADGATVAGLTLAGTPDGPGLRTADTASGYQVTSNLIVDNARGVELGTSGASRTTVEYNCLLANNRGGGGVGIEGAKVSNTIVQKNVFRGHSLAGVRFTESRSSVVRFNRLVGDGSLEFRRSTSFFVQHNKTWPADARPAIVLDAAKDFDVLSNRIRGGSVGIVATGTGSSLSQNWIRLNNVAGSAGDGLHVDAGSGRGNLVKNNSVNGNGGDGLYIRSEMGVRVLDNSAHGNGAYDCHDGGGPNTWTGNEGDTQSEPGLCKGAVAAPAEHR